MEEEMGKFISLIGNAFGELTVIKRAANYKNGAAMWTCMCSCGNTSTTLSSSLLLGRTKSCGHMKVKCVHGHERTTDSIGKNGQCLVCKKIREDKWYADCNKELIKSKSYKQALKRKGWTPESVLEVNKEQNNCCAICNKEFKVTPQADHEHSDVPKPRGLLCGPCNRAIGALGDSSEVCEAAAAYLRKWGK